MKKLSFIIAAIFISLIAGVSQAQTTQVKIGNSTYYTTYAKDGTIYTGSTTKVGNSSFHSGSSSNGSSYYGSTTKIGNSSFSNTNYSNGGYSNSTTTRIGNTSTTNYWGSNGRSSTISSGSSNLSTSSSRQVWVNGYYQSNGTYVSGHYRTVRN